MLPVVLMLYFQYLEQYVAHSRLLTKYLLRRTYNTSQGDFRIITQVSRRKI